jgi:hypothetical protein
MVCLQCREAAHASSEVIHKINARNEDRFQTDISRSYHGMC